jgi:hypothetical protein
VLQNEPPPPTGGGAAEGETRPPWHWIGFGTVAIFGAWLPLAYAAQALVVRATQARFGAEATAEEITAAISAMTAGERLGLMATQGLPHLLALALASFAGGWLVGRFGTGTGPREAAAAGAATAIFASMLACRSMGASATALVTLVIAVAFAAWGGRAGARRQERTKAS